MCVHVHVHVHVCLPCTRDWSRVDYRAVWHCRVETCVSSSDRRTQLSTADPTADLHDIDEEIEKLSQTKSVLDMAKFSGAACRGGVFALMTAGVGPLIVPST